MPFDFSGKKFLVTGAGKDFGLAVAKALAQAGGEVYALDNNKGILEPLLTKNSNIHPVVVDLNDWEASRTELEKLPALDGVVNAQIEAPQATALDTTKDELEKPFRVNIMGSVNVIQVTAKKMIEAGKHGSIVNFSSTAGMRALKMFLGYGVSKAGLDMVTKQFALELGAHQIRVNSLNASFTWNDYVRDLLAKQPDIEDRVKAITPMGRFSEMREVVEPILYLLSDHSSMVSGTNHLVDGGLFANIPV